VDDILEMERAASGKMRVDLQPVALGEFAAQLRANHGQRAADLGVALEIDADPSLRVVADPHRLAQVVGNLVSNALKFAPSGSVVRVVAQARAGEVALEVQDTGPGVPHAFRSRIFERFARADAEDATRRGGTGLGLAIARQLIDLMHGRIDFESRPGDTRFRISLPRAS
jgi:signal transduction histidine kinase